MAHKILIIDDEPDVCEMLSLRLEAKGYAVVSAGNGGEGLQKVESENPALIVCDVTMPSMDGFSFVRELKMKFPGRTIPIIMLTGKDRMQDLFEREGVKDYLVKPCDAGELIQKIQTYLP